MIFTATSIFKQESTYLFLKKIVQNYKSEHYIESQKNYNSKLSWILDDWSQIEQQQPSCNRNCLVCHTPQSSQNIEEPCWLCGYMEFQDLERAFNILIECDVKIGSFPIINISSYDFIFLNKKQKSIVGRLLGCN
jgi:hypothetical protein